MGQKIGAYEAKTKLSSLLREVRAGKSFTITNNGEVVADLVPSLSAEQRQRSDAVEKMKAFIAKNEVISLDLQSLINQGRS